MTEREFDEYLSKEVATDIGKQFLNFARSIHTVEYHYHILVDEDYDYLKMVSQLDYLKYYNELRQRNTHKK